MSNNKMLIDATHPEETRVVVLRNGRVEEFDYESAARKLLRGNIYLAKVTRVEPSLQAAFVDYGGNRHGFLAFNEIHPDYYQIPMADRQALLDEEAAAEAEEEAAADARAEALARRRAMREQSRGQQRQRDGGGEAGEDDESSGDAGGEEGYEGDEQPYEVRPHGYEESEGGDEEAEGDGRQRQQQRRRRRRGGRGRDRFADRNGGDRESRGRQASSGERQGGRSGGRTDDRVGDHDHDEGDRFAAPGAEPHDDEPAAARSGAEGHHHDHDDGAHEDRDHGPAHREPAHDDAHGRDAHAHHDAHEHHEHDHAETARERHDHAPAQHAHDEADHDTQHHDRDRDTHSHDEHDGEPAAERHATSRTLAEDRGLADERHSEPLRVADDEPSLDAVPTPRGNVEDEGVAEVNGVTETAEVDQVGSEDALEELPSRPRRRPRSYKIQEVIKRRQIILVQVVKEERGNKGAALTTYLSLAGRYTVLMPNTARGGGISRKITQPQDRKRLKAVAASLEVPEGMGLIIRTAGAARTAQEIKRDFEYLLRLWESVRELTLQSVAPSLVYEEGNLIKRSIRDLYNKDIDEIIVAGAPAHAEAHDFMRMLMPSQAKNVINYREPEPLFTRFQIERQLNAMFSPYVTLRSGGYLVINQTEALVAVDVNSGRSTREFSIEETALNTNLEAAEEIARQLKLRDLAGLIVIDFIDMEERRNNRRVENKLKDALRFDRARIQVGRISHFGLMEMSRQRLRTGVLEGSTSQCPHCQGTGIIRSTESVALAVLRGLEDAIMAGARTSLIATTTPTVALYILNNKRPFIIEMERRTGLPIVVQGSDKMQGANFTIEKGAAPQQSRRPERTAVNMDWGFEGEGEGEADDGDVDSEVGMPDASIDVDAEPRDRDRDEAQRGDNGEDGGRRRRRRRRRGRRGDRPEGGDEAMLGRGDEPNGDGNGEAYVDDRDGEADGDDADEPRHGGGHGQQRQRARRDEREDMVADSDAEAQAEDGGEDADGGEPGRDSGDGNGRRRGRRRGRRGGRRGRERDRGPLERSEDLSTTGYASAFDYAWDVERSEAIVDAEPEAAPAVADKRAARGGDSPAPVDVAERAEKPATARHRPASVEPGPAAAAAEAVIAADEVAEQPAPADEPPPADAGSAEPAPRRRSMQSSEPRIERVVVRPDAAETQEIGAAAAAPRKGWWSRKLLG